MRTFVPRKTRKQLEESPWRCRVFGHRWREYRWQVLVANIDVPTGYDRCARCGLLRTRG